MLCRNKKCKKDYPDTYTYCPWCGTSREPEKRRTLKRANGMGSVYKASGRRRKPWTAIMVVDKRRVCLGYFQEKTEALRCLEDHQTKPMTAHYNYTVQDIYNEWKSSYFVNLTAAGIEGYEAAWKRLSSVKEMKMRDIRTRNLQEIIDTAVVVSKDKERPLSISGKEKIIQLSSQLCQKAMEYDIINKNYAQFVILKREEKPEKQIFSPADIAKLEKDAANKTSRIILTLIYSGMRINELFTLKIENIHLKEGYMVGGEKTAAGRNRQMPIHAKIKPYLTEWIISAKPGQGLLLTDSKGGQIRDDNFRKREYYPKLEELGIEKKNPHCTRHTFATLMRKGGVREEVLSKIMGHTTFTMTDKYLHKDLEDMLSAIQHI